MKNIIHLKGIIDEDFVNYRVPSMVLEFPYCSFKCGKSVCQNAKIANENVISSDIKTLCSRYVSNFITDAIVCQGLEPLDSFDELVDFISYLREKFNCFDDVVIYTGYNKDEILDKIEVLKRFENIVVKYGRYVPDQEAHLDEVLGVKLASDNQYAERI